MFEFIINSKQPTEYLTAIKNQLINIEVVLKRRKLDVKTRDFFIDHILESENPGKNSYKPLSERYLNSESYKNRPRLSTRQLHTQNYLDSIFAEIDKYMIIGGSYHPSIKNHEEGIGVPQRKAIYLDSEQLDYLRDGIAEDILNPYLN